MNEQQKMRLSMWRLCSTGKTKSLEVILYLSKTVITPFSGICRWIDKYYGKFGRACPFLIKFYCVLIFILHFSHCVFISYKNNKITIIKIISVATIRTIKNDVIVLKSTHQYYAIFYKQQLKSNPRLRFPR